MDKRYQAVIYPTVKLGQFFVTERQLEICQFIKHGLSNKEIAVELGIETKTVKFHLTRIYRATNKRGRLRLSKFMHELGS